MSNQLRRLFYCVAALAVTVTVPVRVPVVAGLNTIGAAKKHEGLAVPDPWDATTPIDEGDASTPSDAAGGREIKP